jgi:flagellar motor switch protein FliG
MRVATMERANPEIVNEVESVMRRKLSSVLQPARESQHVGGIEVLVELLKQSNRMTEKTIIETLEENEPELADEIKKRMFVFENITTLDDRSIQRILREVEVRDLGLALKATPEDVRACITRNMSQRAAAMLQEDMEASGPVRRLDDAEEIVIARGGDDELVA